MKELNTYNFFKLDCVLFDFHARFRVRQYWFTLFRLLRWWCWWQFKHLDGFVEGDATLEFFRVMIATRWWEWRWCRDGWARRLRAVGLRVWAVSLVRVSDNSCHCSTWRRFNWSWVRSQKRCLGPKQNLKFCWFEWRERTFWFLCSFCGLVRWVLQPRWIDWTGRQGDCWAHSQLQWAVD